MFDPRFNTLEAWLDQGFPLCLPQEGWERCYLRFGDPPDGATGTSFDYKNNRPERGVSVFRGFKVDKGYLVDFENRFALAACYVHLRRRRAYVVEGYEVGVGSAGEPLLELTSYARIPWGVRVKPIIELPRWFVWSCKQSFEREEQRRHAIAVSNGRVDSL